LRLEDDHRAGVEFVGDCVEVREQKGRLQLGLPLSASTEQDDGRLFGVAGREERREVGVGGDEDSVFGGRAVEDLLVGCCLQAVVADVYGVVSDCSELFREARRECVVDEEPQPAASGSSRSCTAWAA